MLAFLYHGLNLMILFFELFRLFVKVWRIFVSIMKGVLTEAKLKNPPIYDIKAPTNYGTPEVN